MGSTSVHMPGHSHTEAETLTQTRSSRQCKFVGPHNGIMALADSHCGDFDTQQASGSVLGASHALTHTASHLSRLQEKAAVPTPDRGRDRKRERDRERERSAALWLTADATACLRFLRDKRQNWRNGRTARLQPVYRRRRLNKHGGDKQEARLHSGCLDVFLIP